MMSPSSSVESSESDMVALDLEVLVCYRVWRMCRLIACKIIKLGNRGYF
jgi:hypothetical protein